MGCYVHRNPTALQENDFILHGSYALAHSCCIPLCVKRPPFTMYRSLYLWRIRSEAIESRFRWHFARSGRGRSSHSAAGDAATAVTTTARPRVFKPKAQRPFFCRHHVRVKLFHATSAQVRFQKSSNEQIQMLIP